MFRSWHTIFIKYATNRFPMLDINLIRDNPAIVKKDLEKRHQLDKLQWIEEIRRMDTEWKNLKQQVDELRHFRNKISQEIADVKKKGGDASKLKKQAAEVPTMILQKEGLQKSSSGRSTIT